MKPLFNRQVFCFTLLFLLYSSSLHAQRAKAGHTLTEDEAKMVKKDAGTMFAAGNYKGSLKAYLDLIKTDQQNPEYNYRLGYCYLKSNSDKTEAVKYFLTAAEHKSVKRDVYLFLGVAYMNAGKWDEAERAFQDYVSQGGGKPVKDFPSVERLIENCRNGKMLSVQPVNVEFINPGKSINSPDDEFNPYISADGNTLLFSARRKGNAGGFIPELGIYTSDIFWSQWKDSIWSKSRSLGGLVNGIWDEEIVGISTMADNAFIYFDNESYFADLGYSVLKGKTWQKYVMLPENVNSKQTESSASISPDGKMLIVSSNRKDGNGGFDLYHYLKNDADQWEGPQNLGTTINTKLDEVAPFISADGRTLYFASQGHNSMGGYDIFRSKWNNQSKEWSVPENLGYPINTADDESSFSITGTGKTAYMSRYRNDGLGERDIWQLKLKDSERFPEYILFTGNITSTSGLRVDIKSATLEQKESGEKWIFKPQSNLASVVFSVNAGNYRLIVEGNNFETLEKDLLFSEQEKGTEIIFNLTVNTARKN
ncbi:MAG: hypothetical protein DWQ39_13410 [Bacteroidetes bacterium]|nr:MAG: hypothetical protein DWQ39_13410 [Bacteroidota bacterium]